MIDVDWSRLSKILFHHSWGFFNLFLSLSGRRYYSVTRLGDFWKFLSTNCVTKNSPKYFVILGLLWKASKLKLKLLYLLLGQTFESIGLLFILTTGRTGHKHQLSSLTNRDRFKKIQNLIKNFYVFLHRVEARPRRACTPCTRPRVTRRWATASPGTWARDRRADWGTSGNAGGVRSVTGISTSTTRTSPRPRPEWTCWPARWNQFLKTDSASTLSPTTGPTTFR